MDQTGSGLVRPNPVRPELTRIGSGRRPDPSSVRLGGWARNVGPAQKITFPSKTNRPIRPQGHPSLLKKIGPQAQKPTNFLKIKLISPTKSISPEVQKPKTSPHYSKPYPIGIHDRPGSDPICIFFPEVFHGFEGDGRDAGDLAVAVAAAAGRRRRRGQRHCRGCVGSRLRSGIGRRRQVVAAATGAGATASGVEAGRVGGDEGGRSDAPRMGSTEAASSRSRGCCWRNSDAASGNGNSRPSGDRLLRVTGRADAERDQQRRYRDFRGAKQW